MPSVNVPARVGLAGNPSDGFGGRAVASTVPGLGATVHLQATGARGLRLGGQDTFDSPAHLARHLSALSDGERLLGAAVLASGLEVQGVALSFRTTIPRQAGLSGSSAVILGALHLLHQHLGRVPNPMQLATAALNAERRCLGITAGPMDRVIQALGGVAWMDCARPLPHIPTAAVHPPGPVPLFVCWSDAPGTPSGQVHQPVRSRWDDGDPRVRQVIGQLPGLADRARAALEAGDLDTLADIMDANMALRSRLWPIHPRDAEAVTLARGLGAGAKQAGSGGAVVGCLRPGTDWPQLEARLQAAGYRTLGWDARRAPHGIGGPDPVPQVSVHR